MTIVYNRPKCYGSEWEAYVDDEATARGIDEILQQEAQDHRDHLEEVAYEDSLEGY